MSVSRFGLGLVSIMLCNPHPTGAQTAQTLRVTSGTVSVLRPGLFHVEVGGMRAVTAASNAVKLSFVYRGPSRDVAPLANGELRRQIGVKLRAKDDCNVIYVMWHIEPDSGVNVSVKSNPGKATHAECGAEGYINLKPARAGVVAPVVVGAAHTLRAVIEGVNLVVTADGVAVWEGVLPAEAFAFDGPVGVRSDNGAFDFSVE